MKIWSLFERITSDDLNNNFEELQNGTGIDDRAIGYKKLELPVAFSARQSTATNTAVAGWVNLEYDEEIYNYGEAYDTTTYAFTAPYNGVYHLGASTGFAVGNERALVSLWKNGTEIARSFDVEHQESSPTFEIEANNVSCDLLLEAGDTVVARSYTDDGIDTSTNDAYGNFFYGHLICRTD